MSELTDLKCRTAKPKAKPYRLFDGGGLYLEVAPSGGKWWRLKYRIGGREKRISLGVYGDVSLKAARAKRDEQRKVLATGVDPSNVKKALRIASAAGSDDSFEVVAREWLKKYAARWTEDYRDEILGRLELNVFPWLGAKCVRDISAPEVLATLRRIEERGANETAHRVRQISSQVFRYGIATGRTDRDVAANLRGALVPVTPTHLAALTKPDDVAKLLRAIDGYVGALVTRSALRLSPLVFLRPGELRLAPWTEFDLDNAEWNIPAERMKMGLPHLVPLSTQAVEILRDLRPLTCRSRYVFPSVRSRDRAMSNNTINAALRSLGFSKEEMTGHGFRATARTILDEVLGFRPDIIEHQLAHKVKDPNGRAYNRTTYLPERRVMMQRWADYLNELRSGSVAGRVS
ncbi:MAG: integrase arm-type DNA-binding domain-containing protein [Gemmatimonadaceae bacterium]|nr:integrase arm-type DNA-binding domain-containing protein [Gemmatimonadaceae bacterium]